jgi:hypothetical protein
MAAKPTPVSKAFLMKSNIILLLSMVLFVEADYEHF